MGHPRPLFHLSSVFSNHSPILLQINKKNNPSSIRCLESNPRPLDYQSPPITTRPGLQSNWLELFLGPCDITPDNLEIFGIYSGRNGTGLDDRSINTGAFSIRDRGRMESWHNQKVWWFNLVFRDTWSGAKKWNLSVSHIPDWISQSILINFWCSFS